MEWPDHYIWPRGATPFWPRGDWSHPHDWSGGGQTTPKRPPPQKKEKKKRMDFGLLEVAEPPPRAWSHPILAVGGGRSQPQALEGGPATPKG
jgi:hypothetical protein